LAAPPDDRRRRKLEVQRAVEHLKAVYDANYGEHHSWSLHVVIRASRLQYWQTEITEQPDHDDSTDDIAS